MATTILNSRDTALQNLAPRILGVQTNFISLSAPVVEFNYGQDITTANPSSINITAILAGVLAGTVTFNVTGLNPGTNLNVANNILTLQASQLAGDSAIITASINYQGTAYTSLPITVVKNYTATSLRITRLTDLVVTDQSGNNYQLPTDLNTLELYNGTVLLSNVIYDIIDGVDLYTTTSIIFSNSISTGNKIFVIGPNLAWIQGDYILFKYNDSNYMYGTVVAYYPNNGLLTVNISNIQGSGTYTTYNVIFSNSSGASYIAKRTTKNGLSVTINTSTGNIKVSQASNNAWLSRTEKFILTAVKNNITYTTTYTVYKTGTDVVDSTPPPDPAFNLSGNLTAAVSSITIKLPNLPVYIQGHGHSSTVVYGAIRATNAGIPIFDNAIKLTEFIGTATSIATNPSTNWYIWIKYKSSDGYESTNPLALGNITTGEDVSTLLEALSGEITNSQLSTSLANTVSLITSDSTVQGSVANLISNVQTNLQSQINDIILPPLFSIKNYAINEVTGYDGSIYRANLGINVVQKTVTNTYSDDTISVSSSSDLNIGQAIQFTGTIFGGVQQSTIYYIKTINSAINRITISATLNGTTIDFNNNSGSMTLSAVPNPTDTSYWTRVGDYTSLGDSVSSLTIAMQNVYTKNQTDSAITNQLDLFKSTTQLQNYVTNSTIQNNYYTKTETDTAISVASSTLSSSINQDVNTVKSNLQTNYLTSVQTDGAISQATSNLYTQLKGDVSTVDSKLTNNYITIVDANNAITQAKNELSSTFNQNINTVDSKLTNNYITATNSSNALSQAITTLESRFNGNLDSVNGSIGVLSSNLYNNYLTAASTTGAIAEATNALSVVLNGNITSNITTFQQTKIGYAVITNSSPTQAFDNNGQIKTKEDVDAWNSRTNIPQGTNFQLTWITGLPIATAVKQVNISDGDSSINLEQRFIAQKNTNTNLQGQYTVKIDNKGKISGFGLASTGSGDISQSSFLIRADRFALVAADPDTTISGLDRSQTPFMVFSTPTEVTIGSVTKTYPAGTWINTAFIANATIDSAKISTIEATKIESGTITATLTMTSPIIKSSLNTWAEITAGNGFWLGADGLDSNKLKFYAGNSVDKYIKYDGTNVSAKGLIIYDNQNNVILSSGGVTIPQGFGNNLFTNGSFKYTASGVEIVSGYSSLLVAETISYTSINLVPPTITTIDQNIFNIAAAAPSVVYRVIDQGASVMNGTTGLTQIFNVSTTTSNPGDDSVVQHTLPFNIQLLTSSTTVASGSSIVIGTNGFISLGSYTGSGHPVGPTVPPIPSIFIGATDCGCFRIYAGSVDGNQTYKIRWEGVQLYQQGTSYSQLNRVWEVTFYATNPKKFTIAIDGTYWDTGTTLGDSYIKNNNTIIYPTTGNLPLVKGQYITLSGDEIDAWNLAARSNQGFTAPCTIQFTKNASNNYTTQLESQAMIGWNEITSSIPNNANLTLDHAAFPWRESDYEVYHNGTQQLPTVLGETNVTWDKYATFYIVYDTDGYIRHYNGTKLLYQAYYGTNKTVYVEAAFKGYNSTYASFQNIKVVKASYGEITNTLTGLTSYDYKDSITITRNPSNITPLDNEGTIAVARKDLKQNSLTTIDITFRNKTVKNSSYTGINYNCQGGDRIETSIYYKAINCYALVMSITWLDVNGSVISSSEGESIALTGNTATGPTNYSFRKLTDFTRTGLIGTAPTNAVSYYPEISILVYNQSTTSTLYQPTIYFSRFYIGIASSNQTQLSPWSEGSEPLLITEENVSTFIRSAAITEAYIKSASISSLTAGIAHFPSSSSANRLVIDGTNNRLEVYNNGVLRVRLGNLI